MYLLLDYMEYYIKVVETHPSSKCIQAIINYSATTGLIRRYARITKKGTCGGMNKEMRCSFRIFFALKTSSNRKMTCCSSFHNLWKRFLSADLSTISPFKNSSIQYSVMGHKESFLIGVVRHVVNWQHGVVKWQHFLQYSSAFQ